MNFNYFYECPVCMEECKPFYVLLCAHQVCTDGVPKVEEGTYSCPVCRELYDKDQIPTGKGIQLEGGDETYLKEVAKRNYNPQRKASCFEPDPVSEQQLRECLALYREPKSNQRKINEGANPNCRAKYFEGNKGYFSHIEGYYGNSEDGAKQAKRKLSYDLNFFKSLIAKVAPFTANPGDGFLKNKFIEEYLHCFKMKTVVEADKYFTEIVGPEMMLQRLLVKKQKEAFIRKTLSTVYSTENLEKLFKELLDVADENLQTLLADVGILNEEDFQAAIQSKTVGEWLEIATDAKCKNLTESEIEDIKSKLAYLMKLQNYYINSLKRYIVSEYPISLGTTTGLNICQEMQILSGNHSIPKFKNILPLAPRHTHYLLRTRNHRFIMSVAVNPSKNLNILVFDRVCKLTQILETHGSDAKATEVLQEILGVCSEWNDSEDRSGQVSETHQVNLVSIEAKVYIVFCKLLEEKDAMGLKINVLKLHNFESWSLVAKLDLRAEKCGSFPTVKAVEGCSLTDTDPPADAILMHFEKGPKMDLLKLTDSPKPPYGMSMKIFDSSKVNKDVLEGKSEVISDQEMLSPEEVKEEEAVKALARFRSKAAVIAQLAKHITTELKN